MGFLSGFIEKGRAKKIDSESRFVNAAFSRLPEHRRTEIAAAFQSEFDEIVQREDGYLAAGGIENLNRQLDAGRELAIASVLSTNFTVSLTGVGAWFANAYKQTEISETVEMKMLRQTLHDLIQHLHILARE